MDPPHLREKVDVARALLDDARDHTGARVSDRLLRCAAIGSGGNLEALRDLVGLLRVDWRDVIVAGEYELRGGKLEQVRDLTRPID